MSSGRKVGNAGGSGWVKVGGKNWNVCWVSSWIGSAGVRRVALFGMGRSSLSADILGSIEAFGEFEVDEEWVTSELGEKGSGFSASGVDLRNVCCVSGGKLSGRSFV